MAPEHMQINTAKVVHETIDNEVIIINLESGAYYNLVDAGLDVWQAVTQGLPRDGVIDALAAAYATDRATVAPAVEALIDELLREEILTPDPATAPAPDAALPPRARAAFVAPALTKYTNMADLLLLDPIHDVDEQGWPRARTE